MADTTHTSDILTQMNLKVGRGSLVYAKVRAILELELVPLMQATLSVEEFTRIKPKAFRFAGQDLGQPDDPTAWPVVQIGGATTYEAMGIGFSGDFNVSAACVIPGRMLDVDLFLLSRDVGDLIRAVFQFPAYQGVVMDGTTCVWSYLAPSAVDVIRDPNGTYSGHACRLTIKQAPGGSHWYVPPPPGTP